MSTRIILVRHATCALMDSILFGRTMDSPLDPHGELQARALAGHLCRQPDLRGNLLIEASPRRRTRQTAQMIAARSHCDVVTSPELDEVDYGDWAGQSFAALARDPAWQRWNEQRSIARTPAGDAIAAVQERAMHRLRQLHRDASGCTIVIVTHAEVIRAIVLHCLRAPIDDYASIEVRPASLTTLSLGNRESRVEARVEAINECVCG